MQTPAQNWQQIIWREWRHSHDIEYTQQLFDLVADGPTGWGTRLSLILLSTIAGASIGILIVLPATFEGAILQQLALAGMIVGAARGYLQSRHLSWRRWICRLESNTPSGNLSRLVGGMVLLGLLGGMIFGPVFWLMMAGLFWAIGGVITWLNQSLEETEAFNPEERHWWFWWRNRPPLVDLHSALQHVCTVSPSAHEIWSDPLRRLTETRHQPVSPDELIDALLSHDWVERFIARHALISLGQEAVFPLQAIANGNTSPLRHTAVWLLQNIERTHS
jgi:hypothetical protein